MRRRQFIRGLGAAAAISSRGVHAQGRIIGFFSVHSSTTAARTVLPAFHRGLAEAGYVEGRNVSIEYLWADGTYERLPALAAELVRRRVDVIVAAGGIIAAQTAKAGTNSIPIIALAGGDPVGSGLVSSINRPGGNVTGVVQLVIASEGKRLELTHELVPHANAIAFLTNPSRTNSGRQVAVMQRTAGHEYTCRALLVRHTVGKYYGSKGAGHGHYRYSLWNHRSSRKTADAHRWIHSHRRNCCRRRSWNYQVCLRAKLPSEADSRASGSHVRAPEALRPAR